MKIAMYQGTSCDDRFVPPGCSEASKEVLLKLQYIEGAGGFQHQSKTEKKAMTVETSKHNVSVHG